MKFATSMLRDYVRTALDAEALGDLLTMSGFELEGIEDGPDPVLDIKVVSNRGDGLSVFGLAREVRAKDANAEPTDLYFRAAGRFAGPVEPNQAGNHAGVSIETPNCRRYAAAIFKDVPTGQAPEWVRARLESAGMRSLGLVVDLTNYVMLEIGQPLHAFDLNTLAEQRIVVRQAREGEKLTTLDGVERNLNPGMMMICDAERPVAVAGVMGGLATEVTDQTRDILLESANFVNTSVRATRKALGLNTEASYRFERSVDPELVVAALNRFSELLRESIGRDCRVPGVVEAYPSKPEPVTVRLRMDRVRRLLNMPVEEDEARAYLGRLGFGVAQAEGSLEVTVPTWRPDIVREDDVIEEIGRIHGYENIPEYLPVGQATPGGVRGIYAFIDQIREEMVRLGFAQIVSHTLRDQHPLDFAPHWRAKVRNPHSPEIAYLRDSVLPSLADAAKRNGTRNLHLFEIGKVFVRGEIQYDESPELGIISIGELEPPSWLHKDKAEANFYTMKGTMEELASLVRTDLEILPVVIPDPRFHPTRQAALVTTDRVLIGGFGVIHPDVAEELDLPPTTVMAEIDLLAFYRGDHDHVTLKPFSRLPAVRRDLAILVAKSVPYASVETAIRKGAGDMLERLWLFDVYEGPGVPEGSHSLAVALQLRRFDKTFTDEEANQVRDSVVAELSALGATLR